MQGKHNTGLDGSRDYRIGEITPLAQTSAYGTGATLDSASTASCGWTTSHQTARHTYPHTSLRMEKYSSRNAVASKSVLLGQTPPILLSSRPVHHRASTSSWTHQKDCLPLTSPMMPLSCLQKGIMGNLLHIIAGLEMYKAGLRGKRF